MERRVEAQENPTAEPLRYSYMPEPAYVPFIAAPVHTTLAPPEKPRFCAPYDWALPAPPPVCAPPAAPPIRGPSTASHG